MSADGNIPTIRVPQNTAMKLPIYVVQTSDYRTPQTGLALTGWQAAIYDYLGGLQSLEDDQPDLEVSAAFLPGGYVMSLSANDVTNPGLHILQIVPPSGHPVRMYLDVVGETFKFTYRTMSVNSTDINVALLADQADNFYSRNLLTIRTGLMTGQHRKIVASKTMFGLAVGSTYGHNPNADGNAAIVSVGHFADYTHNSGDRIRINGGTAGGTISAQTFEISSKVDSDTIILNGQPSGASTDGTINFDSLVRLTLDEAFITAPSVDDLVVLTSE